MRIVLPIIALAALLSAPSPLPGANRAAFEPPVWTIIDDGSRINAAIPTPGKVPPELFCASGDPSIHAEIWAREPKARISLAIGNHVYPAEDEAFGWQLTTGNDKVVERKGRFVLTPALARDLATVTTPVAIQLGGKALRSALPGDALKTFGRRCAALMREKRTP